MELKTTALFSISFLETYGVLCNILNSTPDGRLSGGRAVSHTAAPPEVDRFPLQSTQYMLFKKVPDCLTMNTTLIKPNPVSF